MNSTKDKNKTIYKSDIQVRNAETEVKKYIILFYYNNIRQEGAINAEAEVMLLF